jgi:hypothetical protein
MTDTVLSDEQVESFVEHGHVSIPGWHPYMLHSVSQNHRGTARFRTNPPIALRQPMDFDRPDPDEQSPVERAVLRALGVDRLDYEPTAAREDVVPERVLRQERMREQEQARLAEASS